MGFQIPLLVIDRRGVSIMSGVIPNRRVAPLKGRRRLGIALAPKKLERPFFGIVPRFIPMEIGGSEGVPEQGRRVRWRSKGNELFSMQEILNDMYLILIKVINN